MNNHLNHTKNQHFISQSEQRLNSINPNAKNNKQKIYSFKILNRDTYELQLENEKGSLIRNNLSFLDLYSFDLDHHSEKLRFNFESLFNKYENTIAINTLNLINKIKNNNVNISNELNNIFVSKILNSFRNPYCINKTINTLKIAGSYVPTKNDLKQLYVKILNGKKPHQKRLCKILGITENDYVLWLKILLMLFAEVEKDGIQINFLEYYVKTIFNEYCNNIIIWLYDENSVLLSDRGFNSIDTNETSIVQFNLTSSAFIDYTFTSVDNFIRNRNLNKKSFNEKLINKIKANPNENSFKNDYDYLLAYNKRTIYQAYSNVFCASKNVSNLIGGKMAVENVFI